jgi:molybdate transport system substrate-binding protein
LETGYLFRTVLIGGLGLLGVLPAGQATAANLEVFHADSLAGPMKELKKAFEEKRHGVTINLTSGVSKQLAERILKGDRCDVFAPSSPAVIEEELMNRRIAGSGKDAATWYVIFSANEMVVITAKGNPLGIRQVTDLAKPDVIFVRVTGEKDLATSRTIEFLKNATTLEGNPELAQKIIDGALVDPARPNTVPDTVRAVGEGKATAGVVYYSAAVAAKSEVEIIRFPASVNLSDRIRNAATVPATADNGTVGLDFVKFLLAEEGQSILKDTGQPPVVPAIRKGDLPPELKP